MKRQIGLSILGLALLVSNGAVWSHVLGQGPGEQPGPTANVWAIVDGHQLPIYKYSDIAASGTADENQPSHNFTLKVIRDGGQVQAGTGTSSAGPNPTWAKDLSPPQNTSWGIQPAKLKLIVDSDEKASKDITFYQ